MSDSGQSVCLTAGGLCVRCRKVVSMLACMVSLCLRLCFGMHGQTLCLRSPCPGLRMLLKRWQDKKAFCCADFLLTALCTFTAL